MTDHVDPRIEAAARVRMDEEECSYPINMHPDQCVCEAHGTPFEGMTLGDLYGHYAYMGGLCTYAVEQATATVSAIDKAATITTREQFEALPRGTVVRDYIGQVAERQEDFWANTLSGRDRAAVISFPARVIHWVTE